MGTGGVKAIPFDESELVVCEAGWFNRWAGRLNVWSVCTDSLLKLPKRSSSLERMWSIGAIFAFIQGMELVAKFSRLSFILWTASLR